MNIVLLFRLLREREDQYMESLQLGAATGKKKGCCKWSSFLPSILHSFISSLHLSFFHFFFHPSFIHLFLTSIFHSFISSFTQSFILLTKFLFSVCSFTHIYILFCIFLLFFTISSGYLLILSFIFYFVHLFIYSFGRHSIYPSIRPFHIPGCIKCSIDAI